MIHDLYVITLGSIIGVLVSRVMLKISERKKIKSYTDKLLKELFKKLELPLEKINKLKELGYEYQDLIAEANRLEMVINNDNDAMEYDDKIDYSEELLKSILESIEKL